MSISSCSVPCCGSSSWTYIERCRPGCPVRRGWSCPTRRASASRCSGIAVSASRSARSMPSVAPSYAGVAERVTEGEDVTASSAARVGVFERHGRCHRRRVRRGGRRRRGRPVASSRLYQRPRRRERFAAASTPGVAVAVVFDPPCVTKKTTAAMAMMPSNGAADAEEQAAVALRRRPGRRRAIAGCDRIGGWRIPRGRRRRIRRGRRADRQRPGLIGRATRLLGGSRPAV